MSITIDWPSLTTGPSGLALADSIRDFIHDKFQQVTLPRFIRSVHVHSFDFGDECPVVELKDISDPLPEFYEDEDDTEEEESSSEHGEGSEGGEEEAVGGAIEAASSAAAPKRRSQAPYRPNNGAPTTTTTTVKPSAIDTRLPNLNLNLRSSLAAFPPSEQQQQISTPFLSRSNTTTPGIPIPGGTSNFSYFHLPLSAGTQTPLPWRDQYHQQQQQQRPPSPLRPREKQRRAHTTTPSISTNADPSFAAFRPHNTPKVRDTRPSSQHHHRSRRQSPEIHHRNTTPKKTPATPDNDNDNDNNSSSSSVSSSSSDNDDRSQDLQTTLHISYRGPLSLSLTAEILLDYPMPSFVGIPLKLQITGLSFDGVALLAYLRHGHRHRHRHRHAAGDAGEEERRKVHFCFLGREDARVMVGEGSGDGDGDGDGEKDEEEEALGGLLREIRVESEIGRQEGGKQVLKNVGKVEKFVLEQVRRIFEEEFVWPSFWTFLV